MLQLQAGIATHFIFESLIAYQVAGFARARNPPVWIWCLMAWKGPQYVGNSCTLGAHDCDKERQGMYSLHHAMQWHGSLHHSLNPPISHWLPGSISPTYWMHWESLEAINKEAMQTIARFFHLAPFPILQ